MYRVLLLMLLLALPMGGCSAAPEQTRGAALPSTVRIELIGFEGCPDTPVLRRRLAAAAGSLSLRFEEVDLLRLAGEDPRRAWPSPTILVDGADLMGMPRPAETFPACRYYPDGPPSEREIRAELKSALSARSDPPS